MSAKAAFGVRKESLTSGEYTKQRYTCADKCVPYNTANLNINLVTKMVLTDVVSIGEPIVIHIPDPIPEEPKTIKPIDPDGKLFGVNQCGLNNYLKYLQDNPIE